MTILSGCDFVFEISHAALLKLLRTTPTLDGQTLQVPFDRSVSSPLGDMHVIVEDLVMDINGDDTVTLTLVFGRSSFSIPRRPPESLFPLSGTITINVRVVLVNDGPSFRSVALSFAQSPVRLGWSHDSEARVQVAAANLQTSPTQLTATIESVIGDYVQRQPPAMLPVGFTVSPDAPGSLQPLVLRSLRLRCFGPGDRNQQGVGLFGDFFDATQGSPTERDRSAVPPGQDTLVALSLRAFQTFLFCPTLVSSLATRLGRVPPLPPLRPEEIPTPCGTGSTEVDGVTISSVDAFFGQGHLQVNVAFAKSDDCYEASGTMVALVRLAANGTVITSTVETQPPNIDIDVDFWCQLASWAVFGFFGHLVSRYLEDVFIDVARKVAAGTTAAMLGQPIQPPGIQGTQLTGVSVTPAEFSVSGRILVYVPPPPTAQLSLVLVRKAPILPDTRPHIWWTQMWCKNDVTGYFYDETLQTQSQRFDISSRLVMLPLSVVYSVRGGYGEWHELHPSDLVGVVGGTPPTVTIANLECRFPQPLSAGGSVVVRDVSLLYRVAGTGVTLFSRDGEGNFAIDLRAEVLDASGQPPPGVDAAPVIGVFFESDVVVMGDQYVADLKDCADRAKAKSDQYAKSQRVPRWKQTFDPADRRILDELDAFTALDTRQGQDMARHYRNAYSGILSRVPAAKRAAELAITTDLQSTAVANELDATIQSLRTALAQLRTGQ